MEDDLKTNGRRPKKNGEKNLNFVLKIEDNLNFLTLEDDLRCFKMEDDLNAILTNGPVQDRQPDQHNNQKYISTIKKINLNWL
jgi:hypothetical protein